MAAIASEFSDLIDEMLQLRRDMVKLAKDSCDLLDQVHSAHRESAENLLHYIALRSCDRRSLQLELAKAGLSSLGRAESHVLSTVDAVLAMLHQASGRKWQPETRASKVDLEEGRRLLATHTEALLGPIPPDRGVAIMVTMPSEAAENYSLVHQLLEHGMNCMRINCAHDDEAAWGRMVEHLRHAEKATGKSCRILMDLAGPKLRTGPLEPGPAVVKIRPDRDLLGSVTRASRVWLTSHKNPRKSPTPADAAIELSERFLTLLRVGDRLKFTDARDAKRAFEIIAVGGDGCWAQSERTCYLTPGIRMTARRNGAGVVARTRVAAMPSTSTSIALAAGDLLTLTRELTPGKPAERDSGGSVLNPATIGCTSEQVFADAKDGDPIWFDDGKIGGLVERNDGDRLHVRVTHTGLGGAKLAADKGINLPDSDLHLEAMTEKDRVDLKFIASHADLVALSFANAVQDVRALHQSLAALGDRQPAIVLKIETRRGFDNLPAMLLEAMKAPRCGIMIARGDLAVECGFERLAEVQEEILWLCEAAHVPVIWATQVLESLAKEGQPSRAEITDAAMSHRAECVMLNKGPFVVEAVQALDNILRRMHGHQAKKRAMLRELDLVTQFRRTRNRRKRPVPNARR
jgi:pyruvate kinase